MNCLHICNDFLGSKVHQKLYGELHKIGLKQTIHFAQKPYFTDKYNSLKGKWPYSVVTSPILSNKYTYLYQAKINFLFKHLKKDVRLNEFDIVFATTLFSDGGIALKIKEEYGIPYILAVRSTDLNVFFKYRPDLIFRAKKILKNAQKIIFVSNSLQYKFNNHKLITLINSNYLDKQTIIFNGIDKKWRLNQFPKTPLRKPVKILFVGRLIPRKQLISLSQAIVELNRLNLKSTLTIVGDGEEKNKIENFSSLHPGLITMLGEINNFDQLLEIYRSHDIFAMPSIGETFGLSYIEALTQGLPVIYCINEGIDGMFTEKLGIACEPTLSSILSSLVAIIENYEEFKTEIRNMTVFNWSQIAKHYASLLIKNTVIR